MSDRNNYLLVEDIYESGSRILEYTKEMTFHQFAADQRTIDAVIRNFEIIGEAANRIETNFRREHNHIPWRLLGDFRNRLIHEYFGVDLHIVWSIIEFEMPNLLVELANLKSGLRDN